MSFRQGLFSPKPSVLTYSFFRRDFNLAIKIANTPHWYAPCPLMMGLSVHNPVPSVDLFQQNHPHQLVRKRHPGKLSR